SPDAAKPTPPAEVAPSFDIVRIGRDGKAVMAGRSAPGATVVIMDGDKEVGHVKADDHGAWVFTPEKPLEPGSQELSLRSTNAAGANKTGDAPVVLVVPERKPNQTASADGKSAPNASNEALAIKVQPSGEVQLLQVPKTHESSGGVSIEVVNFDQKGHIA